MRKYHIPLLVIGMVTGLAFAQQPQPQPQPQPRPVAPAPQPAPVAQPVAQPVTQTGAIVPAAPAATVNGQAIPEIAVQRSLKSVPADKQAQVRTDVIDFLIDNTLVEQYLVSQNVAVDGKDVDARLNEVKQQIVKDKLDYAKVLQDMMLTEEELKGVISAEMRWEKYINGQATEAALRELFAKNPDMFDGSMVRARHILLTPPSNDPQSVETTRQQLLGVAKQINDTVAAGLAKVPANADALAREKERARLIDEAFSALATKHSQCPSAKQGGDVNWFPRSGSMVEPFARVAFALKPFQVSDPVQTQFGLHLIMPTDRKAGKVGVKFEDAKADVKDVFAGRLRENLCSQLRARAKIVTR